MLFPPAFCPSPTSQRDAPSVKLHRVISEHSAQDGFVLRKGNETAGRKTACDELCQMEFSFREGEDSTRS